MRRHVARVMRAVLGSRYDKLKPRISRHLPPSPNNAAEEQIRATGLFDAAFYSAQLGMDMSERAAIRHYVRHGCRRSLTIHPLLEPEYLPDDVRAELADGRVGRLAAHLMSDAAATHAWSAVFDPRQLDPHGIVTIATLRAFLDGLTDDTALPTKARKGATPRSWGAVREAAFTFVRQFAAETDLRWDKVFETAAEVTDETWRAKVQPLTEPDVLVSVIMPVRNRQDEIGRAISSVQAQTYRAWELIVVDDGSMDDSGRVVADLAATDRRVRYVATAADGVARARNRGLAEAKGSVVAFLDSDNAWVPDYLELSLKGMESAGAELVYSSVELQRPDGRVYRGTQVRLSDLAVHSVIDLNCVVASAKLIHDSGGFEPELKRWVDHDLLLRLARVSTPVHLPFIGVRYDDGDSTSRITNRESSQWQFVVLERAIVDWSRTTEQLADRKPGRVSVIMLTFQDFRRTLRCVDWILSTTADADLEIIVVDNGSRRAVGRSLATRFSNEPRVAYHRLARNYNFAAGCNFGFTQSTGEYVFFLNNDIDGREGWLPPLLERLAVDGITAVQPVLTYPDGTVQTAGTLFPTTDGLPCHFLKRHPLRDALRHDGEGFHALTAGAMLMRADDFLTLRGFDPIFANGLEDVDFCLRAEAELGARFAVESRSVIIHEESMSPGRFDREQENRRLLLERWCGRLPQPDLWQLEKIGFAAAHTTPDAGNGFGICRPLVTRERAPGDRSAGPRLRWAIKIGAANTRGGDRWGDVPFANDLADALEQHGQQAVIDRHEAFSRPTAYLDDVVLAIRGRHPVPVQAGRVNVLWVISRPDDVTVEEIRRYDLVFSASPRWADEMSRRSGRSVGVLLQATNPRRFNPRVALVAETAEAVFVGGARPGHGRRIVADALDAGVDLALWGPNWELFAPTTALRGLYVGPADVPSVYRSAPVVLNDHLPGMADWGFISNRIFDAVATGTPVITDPIEGLELFEGAVVAYEGKEDLAQLVTNQEWRPDSTQLLRVAEKIATEHSFENRAAALVSAVEAVLERNERSVPVGLPLVRRTPTLWQPATTKPAWLAPDLDSAGAAQSRYGRPSPW